MENFTECDLYIQQLNEMEKQALEIAITNLKSSFDLKKSLGFIEWKKNKDKEKEKDK